MAVGLADLIAPNQGCFAVEVRLHALRILGPWALLTIKEGIAQYKLLILDRLIHLRDLSPFLRLRAHAAFEQFALIHLQLTQKGRPNFEVGASRVDELQCLEHAPAVPTHNEGSSDEASPVLSLLTLDQDALVVIEALANEIVDLVRNLFTFVEEDLLFVILPVQG